MPGIGKTALAVHAAHALAGRFPDRQLFIDLHAHTPGREPVRPEDALAGLLAAAGVDARFLPGDLDGRAGMWRDTMARQKAVLVLDNAASTSQVAPLLPGSGACLVLVTSRRHLGDLPGAVTPVLGVHPGTTIDSYAAAALTGTSLADATRLLDGLHGEGLLTEIGHRRYGMHEHTAAGAGAWLARQTRPGPMPAPHPGEPHPAPGLDDADRALAWVRAERASLLACLDYATSTGQHARVTALTAALAGLLRRDGPWADAITRHVTALKAAQCLGDLLSQANALNARSPISGRYGC